MTIIDNEIRSSLNTDMRHSIFLSQYNNFSFGVMIQLGVVWVFNKGMNDDLQLIIQTNLYDQIKYI